ncbi:hypothetical protein C7S18_11685 [Ahniella affigens]|uniref:Uncharacterized protein n=1 Tax=Ahniella affigens TaxID=2021234 RepID=A0A2P1PSJ1_9GAMM|nr:hypothetical protein C7S18_11685 [Ahniella affigens]
MTPLRWRRKLQPFSQSLLRRSDDNRYPGEAASKPELNEHTARAESAAVARDRDAGAEMGGQRKAP